jgi:GTPase KRas protein
MFCRGYWYRRTRSVSLVCLRNIVSISLQTEDYANLRDQWVRCVFHHSVWKTGTHILRSEGHGFILVYSITSRSTFDRLEVFRQSMLKVKRQKPIFILVGNQCDRRLEREVLKDEGMALAQSFGCHFMETSAKTAHNVELLFANLVRILRNTSQTVPPTPKRPLQEDKQKSKKCVIC